MTAGTHWEWYFLLSGPLLFLIVFFISNIITINNAYNTSSAELYRTLPNSVGVLFVLSSRPLSVCKQYVSVYYDLHQDSYRPCTNDNIISQERYQRTVIILELSSKENVVNYVKYFLFFRV